jgi:hypothetical protein
MQESSTASTAETNRAPSFDKAVESSMRGLTENRLRMIRQLALFGGHVSRDEVAAMAQEIRRLRAVLGDFEKDREARVSDVFDEAWNAGSIAVLHAVDRALQRGEYLAEAMTPEQRVLILADAAGSLENPYAPHTEAPTDG